MDSDESIIYFAMSIEPVDATDNDYSPRRAALFHSLLLLKQLSSLFIVAL